MNPAGLLRELVSGEDLAMIERLEMTAGRVPEGVFGGLHDSRMKGGCSEFAEHRAYNPGDELRRVDWRVAAKCDRHYIKQFHDQAAFDAVVVLDASGSMSYGASTVSKFQHARAAAACLCRLLIGQHDPTGLALAHRAAPCFLPPRSAPGHLATLLDALVRAEPAGPTTLLQTLEQLATQVRRRCQLIVLSDAFVEIEPLERALVALATRGHRVLLFQVLAPEESTFPFRDSVRFESLETFGHSVDVDPTLYAETYLTRFRAFRDRLRHSLVRIGGEYEPLPTDQPLGATLAGYLHRRSGGR